MEIHFCRRIMGGLPLLATDGQKDAQADKQPD